MMQSRDASVCVMPYQFRLAKTIFHLLPPFVQVRVSWSLPRARKALSTPLVCANEGLLRSCAQWKRLRQMGHVADAYLQRKNIFMESTHVWLQSVSLSSQGATHEIDRPLHRDAVVWTSQSLDSLHKHLRVTCGIELPAGVSYDRIAPPISAIADGMTQQAQ